MAHSQGAGLVLLRLSQSKLWPHLRSCHSVKYRRGPENRRDARLIVVGRGSCRPRPFPKLIDPNTVQRAISTKEKPACLSIYQSRLPPFSPQIKVIARPLVGASPKTPL